MLANFTDGTQHLACSLLSKFVNLEESSERKQRVENQYLTCTWFLLQKLLKILKMREPLLSTEAYRPSAFSSTSPSTQSFSFHLNVLFLLNNNNITDEATHSLTTKSNNTMSMNEWTMKMQKRPESGMAWHNSSKKVHKENEKGRNEEEKLNKLNDLTCEETTSHVSRSTYIAAVHTT